MVTSETGMIEIFFEVGGCDIWDCCFGWRGGREGDMVKWVVKEGG